MKKYHVIPCLLICLFSLKVSALTASQVVEKVGGSVVYVMTFDDKKHIKESKQKYGSGVAVKKHVIATNCHVARSGKYILVIKNRQASLADVIGSHEDNDICLLYVHKLQFKPVSLRSIHDLKVGEDVYSIGNPSAIENYLSRGIISKLSRESGKNKIYSDVTTAPGSSGGGLFDSSGNLIGITTAVNKKNRNISISFPVDWVIKDLKIKPRSKSAIVDEQPSEEADKKSGVKLIGNYGDANIGLYKVSNGCFIHIPGRTTSGLGVSGALWFPRDRKSLYIFPFSKNMRDVLQVIKVQKQFLTDKNKKLKITKHQFILEGKSYPVYSIGDASLSSPVLYVGFHKNPTMRLAEGEDFILKLCDTSRCTQRVFSLWGFSDALVNYNAKCLTN